MKQLTQKQENFARYYVECANYTEAYKRAYNTSKMKPTVINNKAYELFHHGGITVRIKELQKEAQERNEVTIDMVVQELSKIAFSDIRKLFNSDGSPKNINDIDNDTLASIKDFHIKQNKDKSQNIDIALHDKLKALDMLMKHLGGYNMDNTQKINHITLEVIDEFTKED